MPEFRHRQPRSEGSEIKPAELTLEKIVHDLEEYQRVLEPYGPDGEWNFGPEFDGMPTFADRYGYPSPLYDRENPADPTEMDMAADVYRYKRRLLRAEQQGQPAPSFFELYGYPDPRKDPPQAPASTADDEA